MDNNTISLILNKTLPLKEIYVTGDNNHIKIVAIGDIFNNVSSVKRQQMIYSPLAHLISEKKIHAISIEPYSPKEWEKNQK